MKMLNKNQIIIAIIIILIFGGIISWSLIQKSKFSSKEISKKEEVEEIFSLSGAVSSVDAENNFLMVKPSGKAEIKVIVSETAKLIRLEMPFSPENPPEPGTQFTPKQTEIALKGFKAGDNIFIKVKENIAGKTEFDSVEFIQILP